MIGDVRYTDEETHEMTRHRYYIEAIDLRCGERVSPLVIDANTRTQASAKAKRLGYEVHSVNMVG